MQARSLIKLRTLYGSIRLPRVWKSHYEVLGLPQTASEKEIRSTYLEMTKKYHPDKRKGNHAKFLAIQEAYDILGKPDSRSKYDESLEPKTYDYYQGGYHSSSEKPPNVSYAEWEALERQKYWMQYKMDIGDVTPGNRVQQEMNKIKWLKFMVKVVVVSIVIQMGLVYFYNIALHEEDRKIWVGNTIRRRNRELEREYEQDFVKLVKSTEGKSKGQ